MAVPVPPRPRVVPAPGRPGSVFVAVADGSPARVAMDVWINRVHADTVVARAFRLEEEAEKKWWRYHLTPGEAYSLAQYLRAVAAESRENAEGWIAMMKRFAQDVERAMIMQMHKGGVDGLAAMIETPAQPTLYFLHATGCEACEMMKPEVAAWWRVNRHRARLVPVDLARVEWKAKKWEPDMTPSLVIRYPDGRLSKWLEGYEPGHFAAWIAKVLP